jgi:hypothetical protein
MNLNSLAAYAEGCFAIDRALGTAWASICVRLKHIPEGHSGLMARLPTSGSTVATPHLDQADLRNVLAQLCPDGKFSESDVEACYWRLARIIGEWSAEDNRLDIAPLAQTFTAMSKELKKIAEILSGHETGCREIHDIEIVSQLAMMLALDPEVGSRQQADKLISSFRGDAVKLAHACLVAARDLKQTVGESGRPQAEWHDEFTALLLEVAETAGVEPRLSKDRISGARVGWLLDAARALEPFLDPHMRSPNAEACGKRLERSKTRLRQKHRQNPSSV